MQRPRSETADMSHGKPRTCTLRLAASGGIEPCSRERCLFWEPGGAVVEGNCLIERLGADVRRSEVAGYLLETRKRLEQARDQLEANRAHREFSHRVGLEL
jgi:hypothetical protein